MFKNIFKKKSKNKLEKNTINHNGIFYIGQNAANCTYISTGKGKTSNLVEMEIIARKNALRKKILHF